MTSEPESGGPRGMPTGASEELDARDGGLEPTGDERVDAALAPLAGLPGLPVAEHAAVYRQVHRGLQDVLAVIDRDGAEDPAP